MDHEFVIPAYGRAPYLEDCIRSILAQDGGGARILIGTSTASPAIGNIAAKFGIPVRENPQRRDIATDWNFAMTQSQAQFVTIAHQDDLYEPGYLRTMARLAGSHPGLTMAFSGYREHTDAGVRPLNVNLRIKAWLCARAFGRSEAIATVAAKRSLLSLGNPVCCPSVMLNRRRVPDFRFSSSLHTNLDWEAWMRLAGLDGEFVYTRDALLSKRVHRDSETTVTIATRVRQAEDLQMFREFWPKPVASTIAAIYSFGYLANRV